MGRLTNGENVVIRDVSKMPPEADKENKIFAGKEILSILLVPLYIMGELGGFIGFENIREIRRWEEGDIRALRITADIIGAALGAKHK